MPTGISRFAGAQKPLVAVAKGGNRSHFQLKKETVMKTLITTRRRTLLATGCVALLTTACDMDPGFLSSAGNPSLTTIVRDNPTVQGTSIVWSENWRYHDANPLDFTRPSSTRQTVWADSGAPLNTSQGVTEFTASTPIFAGSMSLSGQPFTLPSGGASSVFTTTLSTRTVPWLWLPAECARIDSPSCKKYMSRPSPNQRKPYTFPFVVGDINLPAGINVTINRVGRMHNPNTGGTWGTQSTVLQSATLKTDPNLIIVPVHVHVFTDTRGRSNNYFMGRLTGDSGRLTMAYAIRKVFDDYAVKVISMATQASRSSWHREYTTEMTRNPTYETHNRNVFDEMLDTCKVQVRLETVDFIKQSAGLETAEIGYGNARSTLPWWPGDEQTMADHAALTAKYINAMKAVPGAHVFVVGDVNPGEYRGLDFAGLAFPKLGSLPGYALIAGLQGSADSTRTLQHEVGHVLGLEHKSPDDEINAMFNHALTPAMCDKMRASSRRLLPQ